VNNFRIWQPFLLAAMLAAGIYVGIRLSEPYIAARDFFTFRTGQFNKLNDVINYVSEEYVDTVNARRLMEQTIGDMLHSLDPHSSYIPADELQATNEPLEGNFEGIGIEFHIQNDTIMVVSAIAGGPSEQLGIRAGDRIVKVEGKNVANIHISNSQVMQQLRGPGGTKVKVTIFRRATGKFIDYTIVRGRIPIYSVDVGYMVTPKTGYIKVSHFAEHTYEEYLKAFTALKEAGMKNLVLDLRGNPGGYLKTAIQLADEFLPKGRLVVYTEGRARPKEKYEATESGLFEKGKLVVLVDEGSASASEIVSGAVQDWDRATIVGRRTFGKGLVQEQSEFPDGSAIRLTVARYFTPTGRCIQKPYDGDYLDYESELINRLQHGELLSQDSIRFSDSLKFTTPGGKTVYGGGGIMPDVFVPLDTEATSGFYSAAGGRGLITQFAYDYLDRNRSVFSNYKDFADFDASFEIGEPVYRDFLEYCFANGVDRSEYGTDIARPFIETQLKALIARQLWKNDGYYPVILRNDRTLKEAIRLLEPSSAAAVR
jgi:carboxyl-terminal processing protease